MRTGLAIAGLLAVVVAGAAPARVLLQPVAVLPFKNLNDDGTNDWMTKGISETMVSDLRRIGNVQVVERDQLDRALTEILLEGAKPSPRVEPAPAAPPAKAPVFGTDPTIPVARAVPVPARTFTQSMPPAKPAPRSAARGVLLFLLAIAGMAGAFVAGRYTAPPRGVVPADPSPALASPTATATPDATPAAAATEDDATPELAPTGTPTEVEPAEAEPTRARRARGQRRRRPDDRCAGAVVDHIAPGRPDVRRRRAHGRGGLQAAGQGRRELRFRRTRPVPSLSMQRGQGLPPQDPHSRSPLKGD